MSRSLVSLRQRDALPTSTVLAELWSRRPAAGGRRRAARTTSRPSSRAPPTVRGERLVVAEYDGEFAGAVYLRGHARDSRSTSSRSVQAHQRRTSCPQLPPPRRRQGADGGGGDLGRGARASATSPRRPRPAPARPTASWPGSRSGRRPCCGWRRRRAVRAKLPRSAAVHRPAAARSPRCSPHAAACGSSALAAPAR